MKKETTFKDRLILEKSELTEKLNALTSFLEFENTSKINYEQLNLLRIQKQAMKTYSEILSIRINLLK